MCVVYCLDSQFVSEMSKFVAGSLQALSAMVLLELPHVNVLTKVDLLTQESKVCLSTPLCLPSLVIEAKAITASNPSQNYMLQANLLPSRSLVSLQGCRIGENERERTML